MERKNKSGVEALPPRVIYNMCDGIYLTYDALRVEGRRQGSAQHLRGMRGTPRAGQSIETWCIGSQEHDVMLLSVSEGKAEIVVRNSHGLHPFLLSARVHRIREFAVGAVALHVHQVLIRRLGVLGAIKTARAWINHLVLCMPPDEVVRCERVTRWDHAIDVRVVAGSGTDLGPAPWEQVCSPIKNAQGFGEDGWSVGFHKKQKHRLRTVIVCYDKLEERREEHAGEGVRDYADAVKDARLRVDGDDQVTEEGQPVRVWRVEARFHRTVLRENRCQNADEVSAEMPALMAQACRTTVMRARSRTGRVYRTNAILPLWQCVQAATARTA